MASINGLSGGVWWYCRRPIKSIFGVPDKVRRNTCDKARPLSQVWGVEPNTLSGYEVTEPPYHHQIIARMQDCIPT